MSKRGRYSLETQQQPATNYGQAYNTTPPVAPVITVKEWMLTMLIMIIPIVNIVMMFVWAFGQGNPSKQNYFKASLLWAAIVLVLYILIFVIFIGAMLGSK
jgi:succinate dehydrogenase/fumarate reductase cytochrome b subunit